PQLAEAMSQAERSLHDEVLNRLESLSAEYVIRAFHDLGWKFQPRTRFSTAWSAKELGIIDRHRRLFGRMLDILAEEGVLRKVESDWEVIIASQAMNASERLRVVLDRGP